ncbi:MAG: hypothetical protein GX811_06355 [Lentisphaerae bacterium]|nr:hypothetical protein [Lentisphaerota bacterium]
MTISNANNSHEAVNFSNAVPPHGLKVEISPEAREYILERDGVVTVNLQTSFG